MKETDLNNLAARIVENLFVDGENRKSQRLVLEFDKKLDGPGWCKKAVIEVVKQTIRGGI